MAYTFDISETDRDILRTLAAHQLELANTEENKRHIAEWYALNECEPGARPMISLELGTFEHEVIPPRLRCSGEFARSLETSLYRNFLNRELIGDDRVVPDYFPVLWQTFFIPFDIPVKRVSSDGLGHQFVHQITDIEDACAHLAPSRFGIKREETLARLEAADAAFGDILPAKLEVSAFVAVPTQDLVHLMGMEYMFFSMYDNPDEFKEMILRLADDYIAYFQFLEAEGILLPTAGHEHLCQGSLCYNHTLKQHAPVQCTDLWGFMDSQETVSISPDMYEEFIFPAYEKLAQTFGLLSYGCCEPVHPIWDRCLSRLPNLRKVSISPWCDQAFMGERLRGRKTVFHRKPSPNFLGVNEFLDEDACRAHIRETLDAARGCTLEFSQRDVYTLHHNEAKAKHYVQIIREEIENYWQ